MQKVLHGFKSFDAAEANCYRMEDKERLLGVVEGSFGSLDEFNLAVRKAFARALHLKGVSLPSAKARWRVAGRLLTIVHGSSNYSPIQRSSETDLL